MKELDITLPASVKKQTMKIERVRLIVPKEDLEQTFDWLLANGFRLTYAGFKSKKGFFDSDISEIVGEREIE